MRCLIFSVGFFVSLFASVSSLAKTIMHPAEYDYTEVVEYLSETASYYEPSVCHDVNYYASREVNSFIPGGATRILSDPYSRALIWQRVEAGPGPLLSSADEGYLMELLTVEDSSLLARDKLFLAKRGYRMWKDEDVSFLLQTFQADCAKKMQDAISHWSEGAEK